MTILHLISRVHLTPLVIRLPSYMKHSTFSGCSLFIIICAWDGGLEILISLVFSHIHFHSITSSIPISLSITPCIIVSTLASSIFHSANYLYFDVSKPFNRLLGKVLEVQVEYSRWDTASLSGSSSSLHISCLPLVRSYFDIHFLV
jgi:hypothetical protein